MRFSQRHGYAPFKAIQIESMDSDLRNSLWNALELHYWMPPDKGVRLNSSGNSNLRSICTSIWMDFLKRPLTTLPEFWSQAKSSIHKFFFNCNWNEVYDFIEFMAQLPFPQLWVGFEVRVNQFLEREVSGYRFVNSQIVPITNQNEMTEIETALAGDNNSVSGQLARALELLSDRQNPDYRNSIKESISAVEGQVRYTLGRDRGTLGELLKHIEQKAPLHPALNGAFSQLYGYTSDEGGIRHALMDDSREVTFEEAKFMLVACSAFINYVRGSAKS